MKTNADKQFDNFLNRQIENSKNQMDDAAAKLLKSYNHEMFIDAINNKKIKIEVVNQKQFARQCFNSLGSNISLVMLIFSILPYIFIPLICYKYNTWILLVGILGLILGQILAYVFRVLVLRLSITIEFALSFYIVTAIVCYYLSVLHTFSFVLVCISYQFTLLYIADVVHDSISLNYLIKDVSKYEKAVGNNLIRLKII
jgi:hypothetical protein